MLYARTMAVRASNAFLLPYQQTWHSISQAQRRIITRIEPSRVRYKFVEEVERLDYYIPGGYYPVTIGDEFCSGRYVIAHEIQVLSQLPRAKSELSGRNTPQKVLDSFTFSGPNVTHRCLVTDAAYHRLLHLPAARDWEERSNWFDEYGRKNVKENLRQWYGNSTRNWIQRFTEYIYNLRERKRFDTFLVEEENAFCDMIKSMLVLEPSKRSTIENIMGCEWMRKWGLPEVLRAILCRSYETPDIYLHIFNSINLVPSASSAYIQATSVLYMSTSIYQKIFFKSSKSLLDFFFLRVFSLFFPWEKRFLPANRTFFPPRRC
ncbi:conserved hypothetical protein [Microsporum canis CBS 113480]|uniref:Protein kinase domain-containing protein n=1 Tax=Arthroderma otae (strain ATCC MYA-4605 / CBS 113480) TaxID=554155 RepID=C5FSJ2_ARTOC|nr:conserved hypothetical protein [Microsporum canis CBS 113480]EEQ32845.1 conserved hypothetical protein [Microsporum canis CBS 113480]